MAGNGMKQRKPLLSHASELLHKRRHKMHSSKSSKQRDDSKSDTFDHAEPMSENYATWPSIRLRTTIEEIVSSVCNKELPKPILDILKEIEQELNRECPIEIDEQLDFCMLCPEVDCVEAVKLRESLCSNYDLAGKVLWECIPLGRDVFSVIEEMVQNSTKVLFFVTERFDDTDACAHVARTLLMQDTEGVSGKVIPLVTDFDTPVPETFQLVDKLYLCSKLQFQYRIPAVFTSEVKHEKVLRCEILKRKIDDKRNFLVKSLINQMLCVEGK